MNLSLDTMENKGRHVFLDFVNFYDNNLEQCCQDVFEIMQDSLHP